MRKGCFDVGFASRELVAVLLVLALAAGVVVPLTSREVRRSQTGHAMADLETIAEAFLRYNIDTGTWPDATRSPPDSSRTRREFLALKGLRCLTDNVHRLKGWSGPYLPPPEQEALLRGGDLLDPWGTLYFVGYAGPGGPLGDEGGVYLLSAGRDGEVQTSNGNVQAARPGGDDLLHIVSRRQ